MLVEPLASGCFVAGMKGYDMTKKDYILLADAFLQTRPLEHWNANKLTQWQQDVVHVAYSLAQNNPRFNASKFMQACGGSFERIGAIA